MYANAPISSVRGACVMRGTSEVKDTDGMTLASVARDQAYHEQVAMDRGSQTISPSNGVYIMWFDDADPATVAAYHALVEKYRLAALTA